MKLNINFDQSLESVINSCEPLAEWFERNQETMAYFELTHKGCLHFNDNPMASYDVKALGKMANAGLTWLEAPKALRISDEEKAYNAAMSIAMVYEEEKEKLSDNARTSYFMDVERLSKEQTEEKHTGRKM